jgi:hypothetical protein
MDTRDWDLERHQNLHRSFQDERFQEFHSMMIGSMLHQLLFAPSMQSLRSKYLPLLGNLSSPIQGSSCS